MNDKPCPHCGYCPTCGRSSAKPYQLYSYNPFPSTVTIGLDSTTKPVGGMTVWSAPNLGCAAPATTFFTVGLSGATN